MTYGARKGKMSGLRRWMAKASAKDICIFPVPGADILRMYQNELDSDFIIAPNPREANVLLVMGNLPDPLAQKAAVAYQQIPRPRVLVVAGPESLPYLPKPDLHVALANNFLEDALPEIQELFQHHAWSEDAEPWTPEFLVNMAEDSENGGHAHHHHNHGNGDEGEHDHKEHEHGHEEDHGSHESHDGHGGHNNHDHGDHENEKGHNHNHGGHDHHHGHGDHEGHDHSTHQQGKADGGHNHSHGSHKNHDHNHSDDTEAGDSKDCHGTPDKHSHESHQHGSHSAHKGHQHHDHGEHAHGQDEHEHNHAGHGHGGHDHGDMDFMSMVAMTKDLPRPRDGLPMNRSEVYFGPFHPGLPGGLSVFMELDGDTVIEARVEDDLTARSFEELLPLEATELPDLLAGLNPLTPQTYRLLAKKALTNAFGNDDSILSNELCALENERIASHLNWLATFAKTVGNEWMHRQAARGHVLQRTKDISSKKLIAFLNQIRSMLYLQTKLSVGGIIPDPLLHHLSGPVAKAAGIKQDLRSQQKQYRDLGWEPVIKEENNGWGRLLVRLDEIEQSFALINKADQQQERNTVDLSGSGSGSAQLESPRGTLSLAISVKKGVVKQLQLETPAQALAALVPTLSEEAELSDALVQIVSLDISPWEVGLKSPEVK